MKAKAKAFINIALIKYWGKKDETLKIPYQSSFSVTLEPFHTVCEVEYLNNLDTDQLYIDDQLITNDEAKRVYDFLDQVRNRYDIKNHAIVKSYNHVPKKAGLASSASAFAALALASTKAANINLSKKELSILARLGSGSASRSIFSQFALWEKGFDHQSSHARKIGNWNQFRVIICLVSSEEKTIGSNQAMALSVDLPDYQKWIKKSEKDLKVALDAFEKKDIDILGKTAESNALYMHKMINKTGINYLNDKSKQIIKLTKKLRKEGFSVYATIDAGANVKIITLNNTINKVIKYYQDICPTYVAKPTTGVMLID